MIIGVVYLKVADMKSECDFWTSLLKVEAKRMSPHWTEFETGSTRLGLLLDQDQPKSIQSTAAFSLEVLADEIDEYIERAQNSGGSILLEGLENRILMISPSGHEFEISIAPPPNSAA